MTDSLTEQPAVPQRAGRSRRWMLAAIVAVIGVGVVLVVTRSRWGHNLIAGPPTLKANAKDLAETWVTPHLESPIRPGTNVLWCSTFQLVWNEMCRIAGGDLHLDNEPPSVSILDKKTANESDVGAASCLVMSGRVEDNVVAKIREALQRRFAGQADPDLLNAIEPQLPPEGYLAYAYLFRQLPFEYPFKRLREPLTFGARQVASFGLRKWGGRADHYAAEQVTVLDYKDDDDFVLELKPKDENERILLAKITPAETLQKTIEAVRARGASTGVKEWHKMLSMGEPLVVPILNFDVLQEYDELCSKRITTAGPLHGVPIVLAMQSIRFKLDERGAILKSEAAAAAAKCAAVQKPRQFIFDKPFLILLERREASQPYFALWVDNPELLVPLN